VAVAWLWRGCGCGVAKVLLTASMRAFQACGLEYAGPEMDADSATGE
jgi:hypothetical protein